MDEILNTFVGRVAILFSVLAFNYDTSNALSAVFRERLTRVQPRDHLSLLKLYLSVFYPSIAVYAKNLLERSNGAVSELFSRLSTKLRACNPLDIWDGTGEGS